MNEEYNEQQIIKEEAKVDKVGNFQHIADELTELYSKKNHDYGDSFSETVKEYGIIAALTRITDKFNRLKSLILNGDQQVKDESIIDTLKDLASYSIMTCIELEG